MVTASLRYIENVRIAHVGRCRRATAHDGTRWALVEYDPSLRGWQAIQITPTSWPWIILALIERQALLWADSLLAAVLITADGMYRMGWFPRLVWKIGPLSAPGRILRAQERNAWDNRVIRSESEETVWETR